MLSIFARPLVKWWNPWTAAALALSIGLAAQAALPAQITLLNVSYDPTRELYKEFNPAFAEYWKARTGDDVTVRMSHGGSGKQARAVIDGIDADVATLAISVDIDKIAEATGKVPDDWQTRLPNGAAPYTSTIVFLVREGNPMRIKDWDDLVRNDVEVVMPNPKTSGGARWNYLAAWIFGEEKFEGDQVKVKEFIGQIYRNVPVLDTGARGSTTTFAQRGIGDVLVTWENEAFLSLEELGEDKFEIVVPTISVQAEPPVAVITGNTETKGTTEVATAYLQYLYSETGQKLAAKHFYRPAQPELADPADLARFPKLKLARVPDRFGSWAEAQARHFADGGIFDQIYRPGQ